MQRYRFLKGKRPPAKRHLASYRPSDLEIFDQSGMDDWFRQVFMKQMG